MEVCCIFNLAAHYRAPIYKLMDKEMDCHFFIGDKVNTPIKKMNYSLLSGYKKQLKNIYFGKHFYWQKGAVSLLFKPYNQYIITGELYCISTWIILLLSKILNKKTYLWTHGWYGRENFMKKIIKKCFFKLSSHVLLYGEYAKNIMIKEGFNPKKLHCIANSLDYDQQLLIRNKLFKTTIYKDYFKNDYPTIIYVGRIQLVKRIDLLIDALAILHKKGLILNLAIVGDTIESEEIIKLIAKYKLNNFVWIYGPCYDEKILGELFYNASVCISPGNVGLTAIHAFSYGCPVITHNNFKNQMPEFEIIEENINGLFFEENNIHDLVDKIFIWFKEEKYLNINKLKESCFHKIDTKYNPYSQIRTLKQVLNQ